MTIVKHSEPLAPACGHASFRSPEKNHAADVAPWRILMNATEGFTKNALAGKPPVAPGEPRKSI